MSLTTEVTVTIKGEDCTYKEKFLVYETVTFSLDCPILSACVEKAKQGFRGEPEDIIIKATASLLF